MSQVSEIKIRGKGQVLLTGGRGPIGPAGTGLDTLWTRLSAEWTAAPVFNSSITGGKVYDYTYGPTTYYRFVPTTYDPSLDAFYDTFTGGVLSNEIANRGYSIA